MTKFFFFVFVFSLSNCASTKDNRLELDTYVGMTLTQVVEILGHPKFVSEKNIDNNYSPTPVEPPYFIFFSEDELVMGVTIALAKWITDRGRTEILVWFKKENNELIVFTSRKQLVKKNTLFKVYL